MSTQFEIINASLGMVGQKPITSLDEGTQASIIAGSLYPGIMLALLEEREWTFAKHRIQLTKDAVAPAFGYTYRYILPSNVIRVIRCYQGGAAAFGNPPLLRDWVREGFRVLTNEDDPVYASILQLVDESTFSPSTVQALQHRCAAEFAIPLTENAKLSNMHWEVYDKLIVTAGAMDGSQGTTERLRPPPLPGRLQNL